MRFPPSNQRSKLHGVLGDVKYPKSLTHTSEWSHTTIPSRRGTTLPVVHPFSSRLPHTSRTSMLRSYCTRGEECKHGVNEWLLLLACWSALFHHNLIVGRLENVAELRLANRDDLTEYKYLRWLPVTKRHPHLFCTLSVAVFWKQQPAAITGTGVC